MNTRATQAYMQTNVGTADQGHLLLMLYDGALKFLQQAREKMLEKDYAAKGILISKVIDIVNELSSSLNMERGGDLAVNLSNLYFLCTARLLEANLKMSVERLDSVSQILSGLRSAYAQIIDKPEAKQAVAEISARMKPAASMQQRKAVPQAMSGLSGLAGGHMPRAMAQAAYGRNAMRLEEPVADAAVAASPQPSSPAEPPVAAPLAAQQMARPGVSPAGPAAAQSQPRAAAAPAAEAEDAAARQRLSGLPPRRIPSVYKQ
ncbi:flagellar export chaperone FliS [uncultured Desulfovibrio sp.]|uniref:flagellar export chaperone FliS n=1 Tax=uncultured Desulfovibrio sp. TaxID=167968 RepID=UPI0025D05967|nr:flagellar export chaperone FliS [uncultured Desulfovibrio sp.]